MNFLDTYDIARSVTPNPDQTQEQPSLNEEVNQVIGQLGRFWGGFRKQSQQVLEVARKDFGDVVIQAQKELSKLTDTPETTQEPTGDPKDGDDASATQEGSNKEAGPSGTSSSEDSAESSATPRAVPSAETWSGTTQAFFSRLQSSLPPNIVATVQNNIPESIKHASENIDFAQMRTTLLSDLQRVQGVTKAQAEEYYHKSEAMFTEAMKEASDVLRDAVKVVPPEEAAGTGTLGGSMLWDGTDMWMLPYENTAAESSSAEGSGEMAGKGKEVQTAAAVATRAEALLKRLKHDASILRHNPEAEDVSKETFVSWRKKEVEAKEGGIDGDEWSTKIKAALEDGPDGQALKQLEDTLVPAEMTKAAFWQRFFFRTHQIRSEEEKRKALIQSTSETDEDFSWEDEDDDEEEDDDDDDDDDSSSTTTSSSADTSSPSKAEDTGKPASSQPGVSPTVALLRADVPSRRVSSEDSFDLVSSASASTSVAGDAEKSVKPKPQVEEEDDDDDDDGESDWE